MGSGVDGYCHCGCGERAPISPVTNRTRGYVRGEPMRYIAGHYRTGPGHPGWKGGRRVRPDGYVALLVPGHSRADARGYVLEHVAVVSHVLGKPLPEGAEVHHVNGDRADNRPANLVICEDHAYHQLLEQRQRAVAACGHADWLKCPLCGEYDDPAHLRVRRKKGRGRFGIRGRHVECQNRYNRERYLARKEATP